MGGERKHLKQGGGKQTGGVARCQFTDSHAGCDCVEGVSVPTQHKAHVLLCVEIIQLFSEQFKLLQCGGIVGNLDDAAGSEVVLDVSGLNIGKQILECLQNGGRTRLEEDIRNIFCFQIVYDVGQTGDNHVCFAVSPHLAVFLDGEVIQLMKVLSHIGGTEIVKQRLPVGREDIVEDGGLVNGLKFPAHFIEDHSLDVDIGMMGM